MSMFKLTFIFLSLLHFSSNLSASETKEKNLNSESLKEIWKLWETCPATYNDFKTTLHAFDRNVTKHFANKSSEEINKIYNGEHSDSMTLRIFSPYLVIPAPQAHFDKQCWVIFQDFSKSLSGNKKSQASTLKDQWTSCLVYQYREVPLEASKISKCFDALK